MTMREYYNAILNVPNLPTDLADETRKAIEKLDARNKAKAEKPTKTQVANEPIAKAIIDALSNGAMLGVDLATTIGQTTNKTNGVALNLVKEGVLIKSKVKVKSKGELTQYELAPTDEE